MRSSSWAWSVRVDLRVPPERLLDLALDLAGRDALDMPVIAINTAPYWWALRQNGVADKVRGFGSLLEDY